MVTRRAAEGPAGVPEQYVEDPDGARRSKHARNHRRSDRLVNNPG